MDVDMDGMEGMDDRMVPAHHTWMDDEAGLSLDTGPGIKLSWFPTLEPVRCAGHTDTQLPGCISISSQALGLNKQQL